MIPTIHVRNGDTLYVHGSAASRTLRALRDGRRVCIEATLIDGLVLARSTPKHSMNYRSVVIYGEPREVTDQQERDAAQRALVDHIVPGRTQDVRMPSHKELKETSIFAVTLHEASAKIRTGPPVDPPEDLSSSTWAGVVPVGLSFGVPEAAPDLTPGIEPPAYARRYRRPGTAGFTA